MTDLRRPVVPVHFGGETHPAVSVAIRTFGILLLATGVGCVLYLLFAIYLIYDLRSVLPWNDPEDAFSAYKDLGLIITSACACWLGVKLVRQRRTQLPLERAV